MFIYVLLRSGAYLYLPYYFMILNYFCYRDQKEKAAEEEPEVDPDVAAMMGFGGFGSSKKWSGLTIRLSFEELDLPTYVHAHRPQDIEEVRFPL